MSEELKSSNLSTAMEELPAPDYEAIDATTRSRIGSLAAHGMSNLQIADILLLTTEQVAACQGSPEYKAKYAAVAEEKIQRQIDLEEGWDAVEEQSLKQVLDTLKYNRDPKFALQAATLANRAERRKAASSSPIVVDSSKGGNNVIVLQLNKTYINNVTQGGQSKTIDATARVTNHPQRRSDLPSPKLVDDMLAPVRTGLQGEKTQLTEIEELFKASGVIFNESD